MKKLLLFLSLLITINAWAQNYSCFVPDTIQYYTNNDGYVRGIRIDSVHTVGGDVIYYPFKTPRGYYNTSGYTVLDSNGGSWLGSKVIERVDGTTSFDNYWGDTVLVNRIAGVGQEWIFYQHFGSSFYYKAKVVGIDTMSFLGYTDSVKRILISAYNGMNINPLDSMHGFEILLSKSHGFVQVFDIYMFPYHPDGSVYQSGIDHFIDKMTSFTPPGITNSIFNLADYKFISSNDQENWSVGDIYQYAQCNWTCSSQFPNNHVYLDTIEQVNYSGDTAHYISSGWHRNIYYMPFQYNYSFHHNTQMQYPGYIQPVNTPHMPEEKHQKYRWYFYPNDTDFCMNSYKYRFKENLISDDMGLNFFESGYYYVDYKQDLGLVYYYIFHGGGTTEQSERKLFFYNHGGNICGYYVPVNVTTISAPDLAIDAYPNPASDELIIEVPVDNYNISLVNTIGQVVLNKNCKSKQTIDVSQLTNGIYYIKVQLRNQPTITKKVIVQH